MVPSSALPRVIVTADGSKSLYCDHYQQSYHSHHGALTESRHIFIEASRFAERLKHESSTHILELGFGTGLNYLLSAQCANANRSSLRYTALEQRILPASLLGTLNYGELLNEPEHALALLTHLDEITRSSRKNLKLTHKNNTLEIFPDFVSLMRETTENFDIVFLDAFSPEHNPEMWSKSVIDEVFARLNFGGTLATYSAKGEVRRRLSQAGFEVHRLPGPPGKREILVGEKQR